MIPQSGESAFDIQFSVNRSPDDLPPTDHIGPASQLAIAIDAVPVAPTHSHDLRARIRPDTVLAGGCLAFRPRAMEYAVIYLALRTAQIKQSAVSLAPTRPGLAPKHRLTWHASSYTVEWAACQSLPVKRNRSPFVHIAGRSICAS